MFLVGVVILLYQDYKAKSGANDFDDKYTSIETVDIIVSHESSNIDLYANDRMEVDADSNNSSKIESKYSSFYSLMDKMD